MEGHLLEFSLVMAVLGLAAAVSLFVRLPVVPLYIGAGLVISASDVPTLCFVNDSHLPAKTALCHQEFPNALLKFTP